MAHKIIAVDLGSSSIKLARFEASYRKVQLLDVKIIPLEATQMDRALPPAERIAIQLQALAQTLAQEKYAAEEIALALPGEMLAFRMVDLPFSNPRQIEQTLGYELESQILQPVEELLVDFVIVGPVRQMGTEPLAPGTPTETRVLAACAPRVLIESIVRRSQELGLPLRTIGAAPLAYAAYLAQAVPAQVEAQADALLVAEPVVDASEVVVEERVGSPTALILDVGSEGTTVCAISAGRPELARTIGRGGRHVTDAIALAFNLDDKQAEEAKFGAAFLAHRGLGQLTPPQAHMDAAVRSSLMPLARELKQTLAAYHAAYGSPVNRIYFTGGGSRISGFAEFLEGEVGLSATRLPWPSTPAQAEWLSESAIGDRKDLLGIVIGMGLSTVMPGLQVNFRKGEYSYRSDYSFLRDKAVYLSAAMSIILVFACVNAWASMRGLHKEHDLLTARLERTTVEIFGRKRGPEDAAAISEEMKSGPKGIGSLPIPTMTAFDLLDEISRVAPPGNKIKLDVLDLEIKKGKTTIKATTETAQQVDDFADALKKIDCFEEVRKGKLTITTLPAKILPADATEKERVDNKPIELKQFGIDVKASCP